MRGRSLGGRSGGSLPSSGGTERRDSGGARLATGAAARGPTHAVGAAGPVGSAPTPDFRTGSRPVGPNSRFPYRTINKASFYMSAFLLKA
jgi:hypothetical protein